ncbi:MAG: 50S ribosomal protein L34e [Candidatus Marsarchaeota archaeon]|jgi:large subunit ribosomal protein L34e|nr:50S ribosomal protein L34e [Candidatus Marsarchaeota archaeon]
MPKPMHRSTSFKKVHKITAKKRNVVHYRRAKNSMPHCALCRQELNGINEHGGKSRRTNNRIFGGVLCAKCTSEIIKLGSRVEHGEIDLSNIGIKERAFVLQLVAH